MDKIALKHKLKDLEGRLKLIQQELEGKEREQEQGADSTVLTVNDPFLTTDCTETFEIKIVYKKKESS